MASANASATGVGSTPYASTGLNSNYQTFSGQNGTGPVPRADLNTAQVGSIWGEAYHKTQKHMYFTTFLKRHSGMADGSGYIYNVDYSGATPSLAGKFDLQGVTPSNGGSAIDLGSVTRTGSADYTLSNNKLTPSRDIDAFGKVATMSYGDADIQPGTDYLWTVNLYQKALIRVDVSGNPTSVPSDVRQYILSSLPGYPTSSTGVLRPWGLAFAHGKAYLGVVDDASISTQQSDLKAIVLEFDPDNIAAGFTQKLSFDPNLKRQIAGSWIPFFPWVSSFATPPVSLTSGYYYRPQPVLSDMEFDENGNMYVSFFDRWGHQMGYWNYLPLSGNSTTVRPAVYGEILKACNTGSTTNWEIEGTGTCHTGTTEFIQDVSGDNERESSEGAVALLKGKNQLLQVSIDPHPQGAESNSVGTYWTTQGVNTYNLSNGQISNWYSFYQSGSVETYGKANGMGDVELIVPPAPIEIGNRVWLDTNGNGIQDADEDGIPNVQVQLISGGATVATATTAADGTYYFTNATGISTTSTIYGISQLQPNTAHTVHFPTTVTVSSTNYSLTTATAGSDTLIDSNAAPASGDVVVAATDIPVAGANNHSFDVGYAAAVTCPTITVTPNPLPGGTVGVAYSASPSASASDSGGYTYTWTASSLPSGLAVDSGTGAVSGTPTATGSATITASTTVAGQTCSGSAPLTVSAAALQADLEVKKLADKATANSGDTVRYTITVTNKGPDTATGVEVTDTLPAGVTYSAHNASQGSFTMGTGIWVVGTLTNGASATLTIDVTVD